MIAIIDYGLGNLRSIANMLKKIGIEAVVSSDPAVIERADKLVLPGVGAFDAGMKNLTERGLIPVLTSRVREQRTPLLGVCLGMQLFCRRSEEGQEAGLGWLDAEVIRFRFDNNPANLKIPHMGWDTVSVRQPHSLFHGLEADNRFYFVHSYHVVCQARNNVLTETLYGFDFTSAVVSDNIIGVQFHPEKSHKFGMRLLQNFAERT